MNALLQEGNAGLEDGIVHAGMRWIEQIDMQRRNVVLARGAVEVGKPLGGVVQADPRIRQFQIEDRATTLQ